MVQYPPWYLVLHRHICAIPYFATYRAIIVRYPTKTSTKMFCDTIATSSARSEKYRCWASKLIESCGGRASLSVFSPCLRAPANTLTEAARWSRTIQKICTYHRATEIDLEKHLAVRSPHIYLARQGRQDCQDHRLVEAKRSLLGRHLCRTKLPRNVLNSKTKVETKNETKSLKNALKGPRKSLSPVQLPKSFSPALFTVSHPRFQTQF